MTGSGRERCWPNSELIREHVLEETIVQGG
jgi:hypothetical protein